MMKIKTVLFDWEGVMSPTIYGLDRIVDRLATSETDRTLTRGVINRLINPFMRGEITNDVFWETIEAESGIKISHKVRDWTWNDWQGAIPSKEMVELVKSVRENSYETAVFSNIFKPCEENIRERGHYNYFDAEILSCNEGCAKPDDQIYQLAFDKIVARPNQCLFIDDKTKNLKTARKFGMHTILATNVSQIVKDVNTFLLN